MSAILIFRGSEHFALVVGFHLGRCCQYLRPGHQMQVNVIVQMNAAAQISACGEDDLSATLTDSILDGLIDGRTVERLTVTRGTVVTYIINTLGQNRLQATS